MGKWAWTRLDGRGTSSGWTNWDRGMRDSKEEQLRELLRMERGLLRSMDGVVESVAAKKRTSASNR